VGHLNFKEELTVIYIYIYFFLDRKWKKCSLEEFARMFKMQEMEKQAYLLRQVSD